MLEKPSNHTQERDSCTLNPRSGSGGLGYHGRWEIHRTWRLWPPLGSHQSHSSLLFCRYTQWEVQDGGRQELAAQERPPQRKPASLLPRQHLLASCALLTPKLAPTFLCSQCALPELSWTHWDLPLKWSITAERQRARAMLNPSPFSHIPAMQSWARCHSPLGQFVG